MSAPTVPIIQDPWSAVATQCQRDARAFVDAAIARAIADGKTRTGVAAAAYDALGTLYGGLMAQNARLSADVAILSERVGRSWWRRWLGVSP
jgi:leucyl aminopeptidase